MKHLEVSDGVTWCDVLRYEYATDDPRDASCVACLRTAAAYGAAAAMRYAAVENGATRDPELVRERDEAMERFNTLQDELEREGAFFCTDCKKLHQSRDRGLHVYPTSWCVDCAPHAREDA